MNETEENFLSAFTECKTIQENSQVRLLDFSPNGEHFSYMINDSLKIYAAKSGVLKNIIAVQMDTMCYFQNNTLLHSKDNNIFYLSIHDNGYLRTFESHKDKIMSISANDVEDTFMSVGKSSIKIWDIRYSNPIVSFNSYGKIGAISRDNNFALADNNFVYTYDIRNCVNPLETKPIKPNFYKKMWYTADSACIGLSSFKSNLFLDSKGDYITHLNLENECDGCCINESNIFLCGSSRNVLAYKIQDKKRIGRSLMDNLEVSVIRSNPVISQFIVASDYTLKVFNRTL